MMFESQVSSKMLFYVHPSWRKDVRAHTPLLFPFWGNAFTDKMPFQKALFDRHQFDTRHYDITDDLEKSEVILMPYSHRIALASYPELFEECKRVARESGKKLFVDGVGDIEHPIADKGVIVLRYGGYRFLNSPNEIHIQPYSDDCLEELGLTDVPHHEFSKGKPSVGFAGRATLPFMQALRGKIKDLPSQLYSYLDPRYGAMKKGVFFREDAMQVLERDNRIDTRFLNRSTYSANRETMEKSPEDLRTDFIENILSTDYALDVRGDANASVRLAEIMSLGRIPILIDTERNLAGSGECDYSTFSLVVDFRDLSRLPEKILEFHAGMTPEKYRSMQLKAREVFVKFMRTDALMPIIVKRIRAMS